MAVPAGGRTEWMKMLRERVLPALRAFNPDLLIISAGFDAANSDVVRSCSNVIPWRSASVVHLTIPPSDRVSALGLDERESEIFYVSFSFYYISY